MHRGLLLGLALIAAMPANAAIETRDQEMPFRGAREFLRGKPSFLLVA